VGEWVRGRKILGHGEYGETKEKPTGRLSDLTKEQNQELVHRRVTQVNLNQGEGAFPVKAVKAGFNRDEGDKGDKRNHMLLFRHSGQSGLSRHSFEEATTESEDPESRVKPW